MKRSTSMPSDLTIKALLPNSSPRSSNGNPSYYPIRSTYALDNGSVTISSLIQLIPIPKLYFTSSVSCIGLSIEPAPQYPISLIYTHASLSCTLRVIFGSICASPLLLTLIVFHSVLNIAVYTSNRALIIINRILIMVLHLGPRQCLKYLSRAVSERSQTK